MRCGAIRGEDGVAVVMVMALVGVLVLVGLIGTGAAAIVVAHRRAQAAADLAALGAAVAVAEGGDACVAAADLAVQNGATTSACVVVGAVVTVDVVVRLPEALGQRTVSARARAGPASTEQARSGQSPSRSTYATTRLNNAVVPAGSESMVAGSSASS
jgi:secretion/DNA translocation related TadE-like protein